MISIVYFTGSNSKTSYEYGFIFSVFGLPPSFMETRITASLAVGLRTIAASLPFLRKV